MVTQCNKLTSSSYFIVFLLTFFIPVSNAGISHSKTKIQKGKLAVLDNIIVNGTFEQLKIFLDNNPIDLNKEDDFGETPLGMATFYKKLEMMHFLVKKGSNVNYKNESQVTALQIAAANNDIETVSFLIDKCADPDNDNSRPGICVIAAIKQKNIKIFKKVSEMEDLTFYKNLIQLYLDELVDNPIGSYVLHVLNYYQRCTAITKETVDDKGTLVDPEVVPNYLVLATVQKNISEMNLYEVPSDFNLKNYIVRMQLKKQDQKIIKELIWIYLKNKGDQTKFNMIDFEDAIDRTLWNNIVAQYHMFRNNQMKTLQDVQFSYI